MLLKRMLFCPFSIQKLYLMTKIRPNIRSTYLFRSCTQPLLTSFHPYSNSTSDRICWNCAMAVPKTAYFCDCGRLQPINENWSYFDALGYSQWDVNIDQNDLSRRMRYVQKQLHPDRYGQTSTYEQNLANEAAAFVNKAYSTLSRPLDRISYILSLQGMLEETFHDSSSMESTFLMEMMELSEEVDEIRRLLSNAVDADIVCLERSISHIVSRLLDDLSEAYKKLIGHVENTRWKDAQQLLFKYRYYLRVLDRLNELELEWKRLGIMIDVPSDW